MYTNVHAILMLKKYLKKNKWKRKDEFFAFNTMINF